jgi:protein-arginine kinase activator protein McsA
MSDLENNDLDFLLKRLKHLIKLEEYEKCITISQWIEEIKQEIKQNKDD